MTAHPKAKWGISMINAARKASHVQPVASSAKSAQVALEEEMDTTVKAEWIRNFG